MNTPRTRYPLTSTQREIWFDQILHADMPLYNIGGYVDLPGAIVPARFEQAVNLLVQKHDTLRTLLLAETDEDGIPLQTYAETLVVTVPIWDVSTEAHPEAAAQQWMQQRFIEPFELLGQPLFRYDLVKVSDTHYYWLMQYHHLIVDGYAIALLKRSLAVIYTQLSHGEVPILDSPSYLTFINYDRQYVESATFTNDRQYWLDQYPSAPEPLFRPRNPSPNANRLIGSGCETLSLPREFYKQLTQLAKQHNATLFQLLLGALYVYFTRTAQREDLAIGLPVLNRANAQFKQTAGLFTGVSPTRLCFGQQLSFAELVRQIKKALQANYRHQRFPVSEINRAVGLGATRSQLFDLNLSYENHEHDAYFAKIEGQTIPLLHNSEPTPLIIFVRDFHLHSAVTLDFVYNLAYFERAEIKALQARLLTLLEAVLQDSLSPIQTLPVMTQAELQQLQAWNDTAVAYPQDQTIVDLFEQQVASTPDNLAVVFEEQSLTYQQLNAQANQLARHLLSLTVTAGIITPNPLIAIAVERSLEMVIGLLGILKAGGAYVPIDPSYPAARIRYLLEDSAAPVLLTQSSLQAQLPLEMLAHKCVVGCVDEVNWLEQSMENLLVKREATDLAYVIYTSGSTGQPKGVMIEHTALAQHISSSISRYQLESRDKVLQFASANFDASLEQIFSTWCSGAQLVLLNTNRLAAQVLLTLLTVETITVADLPPAYWQQLWHETNLHNLAALRLLILGGEALPVPLAQQTRQSLFSLRLLNAYGPTEATITTTVFEVTDSFLGNYTGSNTPIGHPLANTRIYILNAHHQPLPPGRPGELCIAGAGLARGYLNRPELTAEKFLEVELFGQPERIYKTGDLARWLPDGNLEYLGRIDQQIKLRGFRIELGEIEAVLTQHEAVKEAVVVLQDKENNPRLAAYVTLATSIIDVTSILRAWLKTRLPEYMLPASFTVLEKLPLTPNGKIDRRALPAPDFTPGREHLAPRTETERLLLNLWSQVLGLELTSIQANFFEAGGHSLLATQLASRIRESFQVEMPLRIIFEHATLQAQAQWLDNQHGHLALALPPIAKLAAGEPLVLSLAQQWFWFLSHFDQQAAAHHMFSAWQLEGVLNIEALQQSFFTLIERHDNLRRCFPETADTVNVQCLPSYDPLIQMEVSGFAETEQQRQVEMLLAQFHQQPFDLGKGPLLRLHLLKLGTTTHLLWLGIHHILGDAWSLGILEREWRILYTAYSQGQPSPLPPLSVQYTDYAVWQQRYLQGEVLQAQVDYWLEQLTGAPELLKLPTDYRRPDQQQNQGGVVAWQISKELTDQLQHLARQRHSTLFMVLFSTFNLLLYRYSGQRDICVGTPVVNRTQRQTEEMIGLFLNLLVLRTRLSPTDTFLDLLKQVRQQTLNAYAHRDVPFESLVQRLQPQRQTGYNPYFQVMFNLVNIPDTVRPELPGLTVTPFHHTQTETPISNLDIVFALQETAAGLHGQLVFDQALFREETIQFLADSFTGLLEQIVNGVDTPLHRFSLAERVVNYYPLSSSQREIWFDQMLHEGVPLYNIGGYVQLDGVIEPELFEQAVNCLVEKHDTLRTILTQARDGDGIPLQTYLPPGLIKVPLHDFSGDDDPHQAARRWMQQRFETPFDLDGQPLFRYDLLKLQENRYYWLMQYHHLIVDGYAIALLKRSLAAIYTQLSQGEVPTLDSPSYLTFINYDRQYVESATFTNDRQYWLDQYPNAPEPLFRPRNPSPNANRLIGSGCETLSLPREFYKQLTQLAKQHNATLFQLLLGALYVYFTRTAQREDLAIGLPVLNRANAQFKQTAGLFTSVSPTRLCFGQQLSFAELVRQIKKTLQANYRHQRFPVSEINRAVGLGTARSQLFDLNLSYENHEHDAYFAKIEGQTIPLLHNSEPTPLIIFVRDFHLHSAVTLDFVYNLAYFERAEIKALQARLVTLLEAVLQDSLSPIQTLPVMTQAELQQLQAWNDTAVAYPQDQTIVDLFEQQVASTPDNIAVVFEEQSLTYQQLNAQANQLARHLLSLTVTAGIVTPNPLIAIAVERSLEMVIGLLGILKAGGAYVPIDPSYPAARIRYLLEDSAAPVLLTQSSLQAQLPLETLAHKCVVGCVDEVNWLEQSMENLLVKREATDLAYVIYTSGSTGTPKGVMVEHKHLCHSTWARQRYYHATGLEAFLLLSPVGFDSSVAGTFWSLIQGARLVLPASLLEVSQLTQLVSKHGVTHLLCIPTLYSTLLSLPNHEALTQLRASILAGESSSLSLLAQHGAKLPQTKLYNEYGPTENTVWSSVHYFNQPSAAFECPIGKPIANTRIYLLDTHHQPLPPGLPGELCIAGAGLARGYLNRPELTAEKFIEVELFGRTERIYKTGDLARWLPDGNLEYLGRIDQQIKLRGFRIELGEIEAVLSQHEAVKEAVVTLLEAEGNKRLVAYVTTEAISSDQLVTALRTWLQARLPEYMVPSQFLVLEKLPLTPNGKIDRRALPAPASETTTATTKLMTPMEELLASLWAGVLKRETIGREDNFFELGGHSLLATQLASRIRDSFQVELPVRAVFEHPQLSQLATIIAAARGGVSLPPIERQAADAPKVLSFAQQRLWFLNQLEGNHSATYNMPAALHLSGELDVTAFQHSWRWLLERHASLRSYFPSQAGEAQVGVLGLEEMAGITIEDLRPLALSVASEEVQRRLNHHALLVFDLARGPLCRVELLLLASQQSVLLLNLHHIISDGWSLGVLLREWQLAYSTFAQGTAPTLPPLALQYSDYAAWQRQWLRGEVLQQQVDYWRQHLAGAPELLTLPTDHPRPAQLSYRGAHYAQHLSPTLTQQLTALSRQHGVSLFMTLLTTFYILLSRYSGQEDICVGTPIANRTHRQTEDLIGFLVNTLVLRGQWHGHPRFIDLLLETRNTCLAAYAHQELPFEMLVEHLQPTRSLSHSPLFQVMLVLQNNAPLDFQLPQLDLEELAVDYPMAKFDLTLDVVEQAGQLGCSWEYATDLFQAATIERLAEHWVMLLSAVVANPTQVISQLPLLTDAELQQLQTWNDTAVAYPQDQTIVDLFEQQVASTPDNLAVVFEEQSLTYQQLNAKANQLARHLLSLTVTAGIVTPNPLIAIAVERSLEMVIGLLAILKAGGAYVPIDPSYPAARIRYMLEDSAAPMLLTHSHLQTQLSLETLAQKCVVVCVDEVNWLEQSTANRLVSRDATDLAYVIYTSGSTGQPKGVSLPQAALVNLLHWQSQQPSLNQLGNTLQFTTLSFDVAFQEIFSTFVSGGQLILIDEETRRDARALLQYLSLQQVECLFVPMVMLQLVAEQIAVSNDEALRLQNIVTAGEQLRITPAIETCFQKLPHCRLHNHYGPSESHVVTAFTLPLEQKTWSSLPPIGKPIANTRIYLLDHHHQPLPPGLPGELCIAGAGLARGYLNRPELTAEKFLEVELFGQPERIYKTGDLARWRPDGNLEYLGRIDQQIKLRGFRIELGEIEAVLSQHEAVKEAVVTLLEAEGNKRLVAYVTTEATPPEPLVTALRTWLQARLPEYMVPSQFLVLEKLPLTPNGKIDRRALPAPAGETTTTTTKLMTPLEELLASLWAGVLKRETIGREDNFFELGGHSLLATQLASRIRDSFQVELPVRAVFEHPQLSQLATAIATARGGVSLPAIEPQAADAPKMLSFAQQRLWFLNQLEGNHSATYNMPGALHLSGELDVTAFQHSWRWLLERHASLRSYFPSRAGEAQVGVLGLEEMAGITVEDLRPLSLSVDSEEVQCRINQHALLEFDLARGPLCQVELLLLGEQQSVLLFNLHHIISDGWSMSVLLREWQQAYTAFAQGTAPTLPPLALQYSDYAAWQRQWLRGEVLQQQVAYWRHHLAGAPELLTLPTDHPRPAQLSYRGAHYAQHLSPILTQQLTALSRQHGVSLFMTLLTTFYILLSRYSGQEDICVGTPIANRTHRQTEDLIGFFVNTLVLRGQWHAQPRFVDLLLETRNTCLAAYAHQELPFEMLVEHLQPTRSLSHSPLFQVMLVLQNNDPLDFQLPQLDLEVLSADYPVAKFELTLDVVEQAGQLGCAWEYATDLFQATTIERLAEHWVVLLSAVVANPTQVISQLPMLTDAELQQLQAWNDTAVAYPQDQTIVDLFEQQVATTPDNIAAVFEEQSLTYQQLNAKANQLARHLLSLTVTAGIVTPNPLIAIAVERSLEMVIGLLAILKAGGAYVPIDPSYPTARIGYMLEDIAAPVLLTQSSLLAQLPLETLAQKCVVVCVDEVSWLAQSTANLLVTREATELAYVIYTSGSTGQPKGVMIEHAALAQHISSSTSHYQLESNDKVLQFASANFDASLEQMFSTWCSGAQLVLLNTNRLAAQVLLTLLEVKTITVADLPPAYWQQLWHEANPQNLAALKLLILGGEALPATLAQQTRQSFSRLRLLNAYGPTEATITTTVFEVTDSVPGNHTGPNTPIGHPLANIRIYILDAHHQPLPPGLPGELCIAGAGLARGYLNRPDLTAEKFIEVELFGKTERIYKTGDLARWLPDGNLEYLGRLDQQIKLRGFRIELGEIEAVLNQHEAVTEAVVTLLEADGNKRLVAYVTTVATSPDQLVTALRTWLQARLPEYMVPSQFLVLEKLPLTPNGKIDRKALPTPEVKASIDSVLPRDAIELQLLTVWETVLGVQSLGIHDNFFDLGGHSLLAVKLMSYLQQQFGLRLPVGALFQSPTVARLATQLRLEVRPSWQHLVLLQTAGHAPPIYAWPGAVGSVMYLYPLASYLGQGQPFYALPTPGLDGTVTPASVEALVQFQLPALRAQQPVGPYQLLGHSSGGRVAFEMAWQLEQLGETVAWLAILDTNAPDPTQPDTTLGYTEVNWLSDVVLVFEELTQSELNLSLESLQALPDLDTAYLQVMQAFQAHGILFAPGAPVAELQALVNTYRLTVQGHAHYQLPGRLHCPIHLFRASELTAGPDWVDEPREMWGWRDCTHGPVDLTWVPGTHVTMMTAPAVKVLAEKLAQSLLYSDIPI